MYLRMLEEWIDLDEKSLNKNKDKPFAVIFFKESIKRKKEIMARIQPK